MLCIQIASIICRICRCCRLFTAGSDRKLRFLKSDLKADTNVTVRTFVCFKSLRGIHCFIKAWMSMSQSALQVMKARMKM